MYNHGKTEEDKDAKLIGFPIPPKITDCVKEVKSYSSRVVALILQLSGKDKICITQVYAPTSDYEDDVIEALFMKM